MNKIYIDQIFDIPERVHQGDFVLRLTEGVEPSNAAQTISDYVVTPQLAKCFDQALGLIKSALDARSSKGAYLHASFGGGKSHFMAVLTLLLNGNPLARSLPELAETVRKHSGWTNDRKVLVVPYHMIGARSLESRVLGGYADFVRHHHPDAPVPGFYRSESLFADAEGLRETMGDSAFFAKLGGRGDGGDGWGALSGWDAASYESAKSAPPNSEERVRLISQLVEAFFRNQAASAADEEERFVALDEGLSILAKHAKALGYEGVVLFLDELILWLASHAADMAFVAREGQKVAKLVEASTADRPIPLVSFIARQRDLRDLIGEHMPGAEELAFADVLNWWEARFDKIVLEDRNLPVIANRRLLRPRSPEAARQLEEAFNRTASVREEVLTTLLGREGTQELFRLVYPFSPALIQTLIALSSVLQRERTALKLMSQLLVEQRHTLELGQVIPVGDLFDVIMEGDEPFMQGMKITFDNAKRLYHQKLLPLLEEEHGVSLAQVKDGTAPADVAQRFRTGDRLMKTLLLSAMAPVEALSGLTPSRLAALNHGTLLSPIRGQEGNMALMQVKRWAARVGEIKISEETANPVISLHLAGVDTDTILENAKSVDNFGNRINRLKHLLFEPLGLNPEEKTLFNRVNRSFLWRYTRRSAQVVFANVRELSLETFDNSDDTWLLLIDYPFDRENYNPADDLAKVNEYRESGKTSNTLVWLPRFFSAHTQQELGHLVLLEHVLQGNNLGQYSSHLSLNERELARTLLSNQKDQLTQRLKLALLEAYGIVSANGGTSFLDPAIELREQFISLNPALRLQPPVAADLSGALEHLLCQALDRQYPAHPRFERGEVRLANLRNVWTVLSSDPTASRIEVPKPLRDDLGRIAVPLELGVMGDTHFVPSTAWKDHFNRKRAETGGKTIRELRKWTDLPEPRGLTKETQNLLIGFYAQQIDAVFTLRNVRVPFKLEALEDDCELREETLPDPVTWQKALDRAGLLFGLAISPLRSAGKVAELAEGIEAATERGFASLAKYEKDLRARLAKEGIEESARLQTASTARQLLSVLRPSGRGELIERLVEFENPEGVTDASLGNVIEQAETLVSTLAKSDWDFLAILKNRDDEAARAVLDMLRSALSQDEYACPLDKALEKAKKDSIRILQQQEKPKKPEEPKKLEESEDEQKNSDKTIRTRGDSRHGLSPKEAVSLLDDLRKEFSGCAGRIDIEWAISEESR